MSPLIISPQEVKWESDSEMPMLIPPPPTPPHPSYHTASPPSGPLDPGSTSVGIALAIAIAAAVAAVEAAVAAVRRGATSDGGGGN